MTCEYVMRTQMELSLLFLKTVYNNVLFHLKNKCIHLRVHVKKVCLKFSEF